MIPYTILMYVQIVTISHSGSKLLSESVKVSEAAYAIDWYNKPKNVQVALMMITMRSQRGSRITAGKFYAISLHSFANVIFIIFC
jgi:hypothetical protein